ncbi:MAG TPA: methyltransferase domain-containing protein, partial [Chloroflexota bacterium]|nr:methyltransferase domain-containing protein [Chloroflexota bacterium]
EFDHKFGDLLVETGYEKDHNWAIGGVGSSSEEAPTPMPAWTRPACWCGARLEPFGGGFGRCVECRTVAALDWTLGDSVAEGRPLQAIKDPGLLEQFTRRDLVGYESETTIELLRTVVEHVPPDARVLEVKVQAGVLAELLSQIGYQAEALEMDIRLTELDRQTYEVPIVGGPVERVTEDLGRFDAVVLPRLMGQVPNPVAVLRAARELLTADGIVILTDRAVIDSNVSYEALTASGAAVLDQFEPSRQRTFLYTEMSLEAMVRAAGFEASEIRKIRRLNPPAFEGNPTPLLLVAGHNWRQLDAGSPDVDTVGPTASRRLASLVLGLRQDLLQLYDLREADRERASEQLTRLLRFRSDTDSGGRNDVSSGGGLSSRTSVFLNRMRRGAGG